MQVLATLKSCSLNMTTVTLMCLSTYHHHADREVGSQLVVTPGAGGSAAVFINPLFMHQVEPFLIGVLRVPRHPKICFEGLLELLVPLGVGDKHFSAWNTVEMIIMNGWVNVFHVVTLCACVKYHLCGLLLHHKETVLWHGAPQPSGQLTYWDQLSRLLLRLWTQKESETSQSVAEWHVSFSLWNITHRCASPRSSGHAFVPCSLALPHFVHPRATVKAVSPGDEASGRIHFSNYAEPWRGERQLWTAWAAGKVECGQLMSYLRLSCSCLSWVRRFSL